MVLTVVVVALPMALASTAGSAGLTKRDVVLAVTGLVTGTTCFITGVTFMGLAALVYVVLPVLIVSRLRHRDARLLARPRYLLQAVNQAVFWVLVAVTILPGTYDVLRDGLGGAYPVFVAGMVVLPAAAALLAFVPRRRTSAPVNALVAIGSVFLAVQLVITYRPATDAVTIDSPLAGEWYVGHGGNAELVNYHHIAANQRDALDIVRLRGNTTHIGAGRNVEDYYAFGEPILAPGEGMVTQASDELRDEPIGSINLDHLEGNSLIVDIGGGRYVVLAHLRQHSLRVAVGDHVRSGQPVAQVGNSGNSDQPHLHLQIQNRPQLDAS